jgi:PhzF family phenazine biosynthesis protein
VTSAQHSRTMPFRITQVDAFTDRPFSGNPAAVCVVAEPPQERWMQEVAREMNLSETAFVLPHEEGYDLRWFTPTTEVDLCGHATLAAAHVLWQEGHLEEGAAARFHTRSGELRAVRRGEWIEMDFPAERAVEAEAPARLEAALGASPCWVGRNRFDLLVELDDEKTVRTLTPDLSALRTIAARGIIVTSAAVAEGFDFVSRFFAPRVGVDEDPVTGSAHCALAPFWGERLGRESLVGYQVSARGGIVRARTAGDRVVLGGQAVTVLRGELV